MLWGIIHPRTLAVSLPIILADIYQQIDIEQTEFLTDGHKWVKA